MVHILCMVVMNDDVGRGLESRRMGYPYIEVIRLIRV